MTEAVIYTTPTKVVTGSIDPVTKAIKVRDLPATDIAANTMLDNPDFITNSKLAKEISEISDDILNGFKSNLKNNVLKMLGFERDSRNGETEWKVDHCNSRQSEITNLIKDQVVTAMSQLQLNNLDISPDELATIKKETKKEFKSSIMHILNGKSWKFRDKVDSIVTEEIHACAKEYVQKELKGKIEEMTAKATEKAVQKFLFGK
jgi:hypothetical protein